MVSAPLLDAAIDQFGRLGFEGASTREIARASGTAMSSITYHFGGKQGLYLAAADHIADCVSELLAPARGAVERALSEPGEALEMLLEVIDRVALIMLLPEAEQWSRFILREQQNPTEAFDRIYDRVIAPIAAHFVTLVARIRPDLSEAEVRATTALMFGQAVILRAGRASVLRILGVETLDESASALLRTRLRANALSILQEKAR